MAEEDAAPVAGFVDASSVVSDAESEDSGSVSAWAKSVLSVSDSEVEVAVASESVEVPRLDSVVASIVVVVMTEVEEVDPSASEEVESEEDSVVGKTVDWPPAWLDGEFLQVEVVLGNRPGNWTRDEVNEASTPCEDLVAVAATVEETTEASAFSANPGHLLAGDLEGGCLTYQRAFPRSRKWYTRSLERYHRTPRSLGPSTPLPRKYC